MNSQEPSFTVASALKFSAILSVQPNTTSSQEITAKDSILPTAGDAPPLLARTATEVLSVTTSVVSTDTTSE